MGRAARGESPPRKWTPHSAIPGLSSNSEISTDARAGGECRAVHGCGLCLLGNLLDHPKEEVGDRLFDPEPFQLGADLTAAVGGAMANVPQHPPPRPGLREPVRPPPT